MTRDLLLGERRRIILQRLSESGRVIASGLAQEFEISEDTVRRDLRELADKGLCARVYGGALALSPASGSLKERLEETFDAKGAVAATAALLVTRGATVFIDAGSTNLLIARHLPSDVFLRVITNAPAIAMELAERRNIEVVLLGGRFEGRTGACTGLRALRDLEAIRPEITFLGTCGLDANLGITAFDLEESELKRRLCALIRDLVIATMSSKIGTAAPFVVGSASSIKTLVVESTADAEILEPLASLGISIIRAGGDRS
jgi:DeoR/GlpR family transcriptional regulator of sugar metabolism